MESLVLLEDPLKLLFVLFPSFVRFFIAFSLAITSSLFALLVIACRAFSAFAAAICCLFKVVAALLLSILAFSAFSCSSF
jgi:hypothetical protein